MDYSKILVDSDSRAYIYPMDGEVQRRHEAMRQLLRSLDIPVALIEKVPDFNELWFLDNPSLFGSQPGFIIFPAEGDYISIQGYSLVEDGALTEGNREGYVFFNESVGGISYGDLNKFMGSNRKIGITYPEQMLASVQDYLQRKLPDVEFVDITDAFNSLTAVKSEKELEAYAYVVDEHEKVMSLVPSMLSAGKLERDVVNEIRWQGLRHGVFGFNVWDGSHIELTSQPQDAPVSDEDPMYPGRAMEFGDLVTLNIGFIGCNGFYGSLGRCFTIGDATPETAKRWNDAVGAQDFIASKLVPGATLEQVGNELNAYLAAKGYAAQDGAWIHAVGYYYYNAPNDSRGLKTELKNGMLFAVRPQIFVNSDDARIFCDDMYVVRENGAERITGMSRQLIQL